jgi:hypothetical protein
MHSWSIEIGEISQQVLSAHIPTLTFRLRRATLEKKLNSMQMNFVQPDWPVVTQALTESCSKSLLKRC